MTDYVVIRNCKNAGELTKPENFDKLKAIVVKHIPDMDDCIDIDELLKRMSYIGIRYAKWARSKLGYQYLPTELDVEWTTFESYRELVTELSSLFTSMELREIIFFGTTEERAIQLMHIVTEFFGLNPVGKRSELPEPLFDDKGQTMIVFHLQA